MSPKRTFQISGLQRRPSTRAPMPSTGSKFQKFKHVGAGLGIDPQHRGLDGEPREHRAQPRRPGMERGARGDRAERDQHQRRPLAADVGIELERAHDHRRRQRAAAAVADDDDLVGIVRAHRRDDALRARLDRGVEAGRLAAGERAEIGPVVVDLDQEQAVGERPQRKEDRDGAEDPDGNARQLPAAEAEPVHRRQRRPAIRRRPQGRSHQISMVWK